MDCPLFMERLPKNFSDNAALSALASLLDDDSNGGIITEDHEDSPEDETTLETAEIVLGEPIKLKKLDPQVNADCHSSLQGRKARRTKSSHQRRKDNAPYSLTCPRANENQKSNKPPPTIGESTLYFKLWKL
jgi:hypothetical protein